MLEGDINAGLKSSISYAHPPLQPPHPYSCDVINVELDSDDWNLLDIWLWIYRKHPLVTGNELSQGQEDMLGKELVD